MVSPGSSHGWLISWDHSTVRVGHQCWNTGKGSSVSDGAGSNRCNSWNNGRHDWSNGGNGGWASHISWARSNGSVEGCTLGCQMISPGGDNSWLVSWGHGAVGVGNQSWDTSEGSHIWARGDGGSNGASVSDGASGDWCHSWGNGWSGNVAWSGGDSGLQGNALGSQVVSPGGDNGRLVGWGHSAVGVGNQLGHMDWQGGEVLGAGDSSGSKGGLRMGE